jgi:hypothetical protein
MTRAEKQALTVPRIDLCPYVERLKQPGYALQFLSSGAPGKTTHLLFLRDHFPNAPYICLGENGRSPAIPNAPILFLDQLQEMPFPQRIALFRCRASFALVSHRNHRWEFRLAGLTYDQITLPGYSPQQMKEAIDRRLSWACRDKAIPLPSISLETVQKLLQRHGSDVAVLHYLYDQVETLAQENGMEVVEWNW